MSTNQSSLDAELFEEFKSLYFDDYEYLAPDAENKEQNKADFLDGKIENPSFVYPKLAFFEFEKKQSGFLKLKEKAAKHKNKTVRDAYIARIDEMHSQIQMLKAANNGNDHEFTKQSEIVYGSPSLGIFEFDKARINQVINKAFDSESKERKKSAIELQNLFPNLSVDDKVQELFNLLPKPVENQDIKLNSDEVKQMFDKAIENLGLNSWRVIVDQDGLRTNLSAAQETKTVYIPNTHILHKRPIAPTEINIHALIAHELGVHAIRRENGENSKLQLLGLGLDRFLKGEEGLASYEYQQIEGARDFAAFRSHFSIALAQGLDGNKRNFREVFEILKNYLIASSEDLLDREQLNKIEAIAWNTCIRAFRGTTCKTRGAVFTKGHIYREGNIKIYKLIQKDSSEVKRFMCGKYDPANERHTQILNELKIF